MAEPERRRRWYYRPGGIPLPESKKGAAEGAKYTCLEGDPAWSPVPGWEPPDREEKRGPRASRGRKNPDVEAFDGFSEGIETRME